MTRALWVLFSLAVAATAQDSTHPSFEAASVKLVAEPKIPAFLPETNRCSGGPGTKTQSKFECKEASLRTLLARAYDLPPSRISGPDWLDTARYEVDARLAPDATPDNFRLMLQALLTERFSIRLHRETKSTPIYLLTVAKSGPKLQPAQPVPQYTDQAEQKAALEAAARKNMERMQARISAGGGRSYRSFGMNGSLAKLAQTLSGHADREVVDRTGIQGEYHFELSWTPDPDSTTEPTLFVALQEQLGLKLQPAKDEFDILVIDQAERTPEGN